jgi:hypothetical protein
MILKTVTITGADDQTDINEMIAISKEFPFIEWGILFSKSKSGNTPRYPSESWVIKLLKAGLQHNMNFSAHLCGEFAKDAIEGADMDSDTYLDVIPPYSGRFNRFQLNFNAKYIKPDLDTFQFVYEHKSCILQYNQTNEELCNEIIKKGNCNVHFLYDGSGGRGTSPKSWKPTIEGYYTGYAGGLNPDNLMDELNNIYSKLNVDDVVWIDAETGIRTDDVLDMKKVRKFLTTAKKFQTLHQYEN